MASRNTEEGLKAMGRHAKTIRLGRSMWESPPLQANAARLIEERLFGDGTFPPLKDVKKAVTIAKSQQEERPAPFQGKTLPSATLTTMAYGRRVSAWLQGVQKEEEAPTPEQLQILERVAERVLQEFRSEHEGLLLAKHHPTA